MVQHTRAHDQIESPMQFTGAFERQLPDVEIREVVTSFQRLGVIDARRADVDTDDARLGTAQGVFRRLPGAAAGDEDVEVGAIRPIGPQQVVLGTTAVLIAPLVAGAIEIVYGRWIRVAGVEVADGIGIHPEASVPEQLGGVKHRTRR